MSESNDTLLEAAAMIAGAVLALPLISSSRYYPPVEDDPPEMKKERRTQPQIAVDYARRILELWKKSDQTPSTSSETT